MENESSAENVLGMHLNLWWKRSHRDLSKKHLWVEESVIVSFGDYGAFGVMFEIPVSGSMAESQLWSSIAGPILYNNVTFFYLDLILSSLWFELLYSNSVAKVYY